jgi:hypothetical protein
MSNRCMQKIQRLFELLFEFSHIFGGRGQIGVCIYLFFFLLSHKSNRRFNLDISQTYYFKFKEQMDCLILTENSWGLFVFYL